MKSPVKEVTKSTFFTFEISLWKFDTYDVLSFCKKEFQKTFNFRLFFGIFLTFFGFSAFYEKKWQESGEKSSQLQTLNDHK